MDSTLPAHGLQQSARHFQVERRWPALEPVSRRRGHPPPRQLECEPAFPWPVVFFVFLVGLGMVLFQLVRVLGGEFFGDFLAVFLLGDFDLDALFGIFDDFDFAPGFPRLQSFLRHWCPCLSRWTDLDRAMRAGRNSHRRQWRFRTGCGCGLGGASAFLARRAVPALSLAASFSKADLASLAVLLSEESFSFFRISMARTVVSKVPSPAAFSKAGTACFAQRF